MTDPSPAWYRDLREGTLDTTLDAGQEIDVFTLIGVIDTVMREKRYLEPTARRVRIILQELLTNVALHVPDRQARVRVTLYESPLRRIAIDVGDNGSGIADDVLDSYTKRLLGGDREHGLLLVSRLATGFRLRPQDPGWPRTHIGCEILEQQPRTSGLARNHRVGWIRIDYSSPKVLWIGPDDSYTYYRAAVAMERFDTATRQRWLPVLATYFRALEGTSHLAIEVNGYDVSTERHPIFLHRVFMAIEAFYPDRLKEKRAIVLTHLVDPELGGAAAHWAQATGIPRFMDEKAAIAHLAQHAPAR